MTRSPQIPLVLLALAAACSSVSVRADYDREADFARYRTWSLLPRQAGEALQHPAAGPLFARRVETAIRENLETKGYGRVERGADLLVTWHATVKDKVQVTDYGYHYGRGWYGGGGVDVYQYQEGTLVIDLVDAGTKDLVWRGWAVGVVRNDPEGAEARIRDAVTRILAQFPPR